MGRRLIDGDRARAVRQARLLWELRANRLPRWPRAGHVGLRPRNQTVGGRFSGLGLADTLPGERRAIGARYVHPIPSSGDAGLREVEGRELLLHESARRDG